MEEKFYFVYIMTNKSNRVLYTGVTSDLKRRVIAHKNRLTEGFTKRYNVDKLVYFESGQGPVGAISREKQIKSWSRERKVRLIEGMNAKWEDLFEKL
jgi:putative endonuclease